MASLCHFGFAFPSISLSDLVAIPGLPSISIPSFALLTPVCLLDEF